jgi:MFS transporter, DHA1 family, tetracycline resistance protein
VNRPLAVIYTAIGLDAVGMGLIFPILPRLLQEVMHTSAVASYIGIMTALYAIMQFVFSPLLGAMSDRLGRRPVLLLSLAGAAVNYLVLAVAPQFWMLLVGRAVAGLTSANIAVATAYITDVSPEDKRARRYGLFNAMFGIGFIIGPVLGGVLGDIDVRLPFLAAAGFNGLNFLLALFVLPESHHPREGQRIERAMLNPLRPLRWAISMKDLLPVVAVFFIVTATGEVYGTCWALWGTDTFQWNGQWIGLSLGAYGLCHAVVQALLPGIATRWFGERWAILIGFGFACAALTAIAYAEQTWIVFAVMPVFALGDIGTPALQVLAARRVDPSRQGQLQGVIASAMSLASIIGPLMFSTIYALVQPTWPGAIWLSVVVVYALAIPLVLRATRSNRPAPAEQRA